MIPQILLLFPEKNIETSQQMFSVVLQTYFQMLIHLGLIKINENTNYVFFYVFSTPKCFIIKPSSNLFCNNLVTNNLQKKKGSANSFFKFSKL